MQTRPYDSQAIWLMFHNRHVCLLSHDKWQWYIMYCTSRSLNRSVLISLRPLILMSKRVWAQKVVSKPFLPVVSTLHAKTLCAIGSSDHNSVKCFTFFFKMHVKTISRRQPTFTRQDRILVDMQTDGNASQVALHKNCQYIFVTADLVLNLNFVTENISPVSKLKLQVFPRECFYFAPAANIFIEYDWSKK